MLPRKVYEIDTNIFRLQSLEQQLSKHGMETLFRISICKHIVKLKIYP